MKQEPPSMDLKDKMTLKDRVKKAQAAQQPRDESRLNESRAYGMAMRLVAEMVSGLIVGLVIGWFLDKWLGTKPWLLIVFIFLGLGAGIFNVVRAAKQIEAKQAQKRQEADNGEQVRRK